MASRSSSAAAATARCGCGAWPTARRSRLRWTYPNRYRVSSFYDNVVITAAGTDIAVHHLVRRNPRASWRSISGNNDRSAESSDNGRLSGTPAGARQRSHGRRPAAGRATRARYPVHLCATRRSAVSPVQRGEIGGNISGSDGLPGLERVTGENSMPGNRLPGPGVWDGVPGGPRDMAKAGLPEVQSPEGAIRTPAGKTPVTGAAPAAGRRCACRNPRERSDAQRGHSRR